MFDSLLNAAWFGRSCLQRGKNGGNGLKGLRCHKPRFCSAAAPARQFDPFLPSFVCCSSSDRRSTKMFGVAFLSGGKNIVQRTRSLTSAAVKRDRHSSKQLTRLEPSMAPQNREGEAFRWKHHFYFIRRIFVVIYSTQKIIQVNMPSLCHK